MRQEKVDNHAAKVAGTGDVPPVLRYLTFVRVSLLAHDYLVPAPPGGCPSVCRVLDLADVRQYYSNPAKILLLKEQVEKLHRQAGGIDVCATPSAPLQGTDAPGSG